MSDRDFSWDTLENGDARMIRAVLSEEDYRQLKILSAKADQTIQVFIGGILKSFIRKAKKRENSIK